MANLAAELESLGITDYEITTSSLEAGSVTIRHHLRSHAECVAASPTLELGDWTGWLWSREESETGGGPRTVTLTYRDAIGYLDAIPLVLTVRDLYPDKDDESILLPASRVLSVCASAAAQAGINLTWSGVDNREVMTVFAGGTGSIWSTILDVLKWLPDVCSQVTGSTVRLYSARSGGRAATGSVALANCVDGVLTVGSMAVDIAALYDEWKDKVNWEARRSVILSNALATCPEASTSVNGTTLTFTARDAGEAGNAIVLSCTSAESVVTPFSGGADAEGETHEAITYDAITRKTVTASMDNIAPPVVAARGGQNFEIPAGVRIYQPGAFVYQIPYSSYSLGGDGGEEKRERQQRETSPWQTVKGLRVPDDWQTGGEGDPVDMREESSRQGEWFKFWTAFAGLRTLRKISQGCITFGTPVVEVVPKQVAYPTDDEDADMGYIGAEGEVSPVDPPANYEEFQKNGYLGHLYVLQSGSFPASPKSSENLTGLKFCQAQIRQFVWLSSDYSGTATANEIDEFFEGEFRVSPYTTQTRRYTCLTLDTVLINRRLKKYQEGTNQLDGIDPDYDADHDSSGGGDVSDQPDYYSALYAYYQATRSLNESDMQVILHGVHGYTPGETRLEAVFSALGTRYTAGRATWNAGRHTLEVSNSRRDILGVDELLTRQQLGRRTSSAASQNANLAEDDEEAPEGGDVETGSEYPMISPSVNVSTQASTNWRTLAPFQIYRENDGKIWLNGGPFPMPDGTIKQLDPLDITNSWATGKQYNLKPDWDRSEKVWKVKLTWRKKT